MSSAGGIRAGKAQVEVGANNSRLERGLRAAQRRLAAFGAAVKRIAVGVIAGGVAIAAGMLLAVKSFVTTGDALEEMSARTGVSTDALQELGYAAKQSGSDIDGVEQALKGMSKVLYDARNGSKEAVLALDEVGLSVSDLQGLSPEQTFTKIAEALGQIPDPTTRSALAMRLFGRSGRAIIPMLRDLSAIRKEFRQRGTMMSPEDIQAAALMDAAWNRLRDSFGAVARSIAGAVAPLLTHLVQQLDAVFVATNRVINVLRDGSDAWGGFVDAVAAGDLALAGKIAAQGIEVELLGLLPVWHEIVMGMQGIWVNMVATLRRTLAGLKTDAANILDSVVSASKRLGVAIAGIGSDIDPEALAFAKGERRKAIDEDQAAGRSAREAGRQREVADIDTRQADALAKIGDELRARQALAEQALEAAVGELKRLRAEAKDKKQTALGDSGTPTPEIPDDLGETVKRKFSTLGTFSVGAAFGLGGAPFANLEKNTAEANRLLKDIRDNSGLAFG